MRSMFPNSIIAFQLICIIKMLVNALQENTVRNTVIVEQVEFIACCSEGECTTFIQGEAQEENVTKDLL